LLLLKVFLVVQFVFKFCFGPEMDQNALPPLIEAAEVGWELFENEWIELLFPLCV
jgi:hypothetical protein